MNIITKTDYLTYLTCPALLWYREHDPEKVSIADPSAEARMREGKAVEVVARQLFPNGTAIDHSGGLSSILRSSDAAIRSSSLGHPIFQALISSGTLVCESDILVPLEVGEFDLFEVKATNDVKEEHYPDVAFQRHVLKEAGLVIRKAHVIHLNRDYVKQGDIDPEELFIIEDVTEATDDMLSAIPGQLEDMQDMLSADSAPPIRFGEDDIDPRQYPLLFPDVAAEKHNVFTLYRGGKKSWDLYELGIVSIADIPQDVSLTDRQRIQVEREKAGSATSGTHLPYINATKIREFEDKIVWPAYFMDFETMAPAIPLLDGTSPYQQVPFQFSVHVMNGLDQEAVHHSWIWDGDLATDPRLQLLEGLQSVLSGSGSIIVYNESFERNILKQAANAFPAFSSWVDDIDGRLLDLLVPFRNFWVYDREQCGSASIKHVLPAWTGKSYDDMAIGNGQAAAQEYMRVMFGENVTHDDKESVLRNLGEYCGLDTMGMIWLLQELDRTVC